VKSVTCIVHKLINCDSIMFNRLKRFDVHVKAIDGVNQQTVLGITSCDVIVLMVIRSASPFPVTAIQFIP